MLFSHFTASVGNPVNAHIKNIDTKKSKAKHQCNILGKSS